MRINEQKCQNSRRKLAKLAIKVMNKNVFWCYRCVAPELEGLIASIAAIAR